MSLRYASTFTGIGGFERAFDALGMSCQYMVEIDQMKQRVLDEHWPDVPKGDDICATASKDLGDPDLLVGGFPCQDISIGKGKRKGLAGERSGLYWEFQRLVDEHLRLVDATRPRWAVLENVPGLLKFNGGRDMAAVVLGLEDLGYGWAYRLVDAQSVGSAQRRPRVIIVAHRGGDPRPAWRVLADPGDGGVALEVRAEQAREQRTGDRAGLVPPGVEFFRKSARPRAKADLGGYATWVESDFFNVLNPTDATHPPSKSRPTWQNAPQKQTHMVVQGGRLRTLTPREWERLQGFPDDWTAPMGGDGNRYAALGDAMNVNLATWLGRRILAVHNSLPLLPERISA